MASHTTTPLLPQSEIETEGYLFDNWFDPWAGARPQDKKRSAQDCSLHAMN